MKSAESELTEPLSRAGGRLPLLAAWVVGAAMCAALILVVRHFSEELEFWRLFRQSQPLWLLIATALQAATYVLQAQVWRKACAAAGHLPAFGKSYKLSLAALFVNQALPSGGISGLAVVQAGLMRQGIPRAVVAAVIILDAAMYYAAYAACLGLACAFLIAAGGAPWWLLGVGIGFALLTALASEGLLNWAAGKPGRISAWMMKLRPAAKVMRWLEGADSRPVVDRGVRRWAFALHVLCFATDAATVWVCVRAVGLTANAGMVFASFMFASLLRTIGLMPGGLGTFEAASVAMLRSGGLPLAAGLSATLLFRGLSFWLPMIPGVIFTGGSLKKTLGRN
jgi:Mg2+-importing ATPase